MTGISANCNSVSVPKTAYSCGLTLSAAIRRVMTSGDNPQAAIPETVIIGDRGLAIQAANFATKTASQLFTILYIIKQNLRQDDHQTLHRKAPSPIGKPRRGKLKINQERLVEGIRFAIKTDGVEKARLLFDMLNTYYSTEPGWAEAALEIRTLFAEIREEELRKQREEKLEELRTAAPNIHLQNNSASTSDAKNIGKAEIDKMGVEVNSPGNNIARIINIGDSKDDE